MAYLSVKVMGKPQQRARQSGHKLTNIKNIALRKPTSDPSEILKHLQVRPISSHRRCSIKKDTLKIFANFRGKNLCHSLFFNTVAGAALVFSCEFCGISKSTFLKEHLWTTASQDHFTGSFFAAILSIDCSYFK